MNDSEELTRLHQQLRQERQSVSFPHWRDYEKWDYGPPSSEELHRKYNNLKLFRGFYCMRKERMPDYYTEKNLLRVLNQAEAEYQKPGLPWRHRISTAIRMYAAESHLAQLRNEPGAIPNYAGHDYLAWVEWLRVQAGMPSGRRDKLSVNPQEAARQLAGYLRRLVYPWHNYDPACEARHGVRASAHVGFYPMKPSRWPLYKLPELERSLHEANVRKQLNEISAEERENVRNEIYKIRSWMAQLKDLPGAIPHKAGVRYRKWVERLRKLFVNRFPDKR